MNKLLINTKNKMEFLNINIIIIKILIIITMNFQIEIIRLIMVY